MRLRLALPAVLAAVALVGCGGAEPRPAGDPLDRASRAQLEAAATREGKVEVYSLTSRIEDVEAAFERAHPGIDLIAHDLDSTTQIARIVAERRSRMASADVAYVADAPLVLSDLVRPGHLRRYEPPWLSDRLPARARRPLLAHRLLTKVLLYNTARHPGGAPVRNLWELTEPRWRGRVVLVDPLERGEYLDLLTEAALRGEELAAAHVARYGRPVRLEPGVRSAGEQWVLDLLTNRPRLVPAGEDATDEVNALVGAGRADRVGFSSYSDVRDNEEEGWALGVAAGVEPAPGIAYPAQLGIVAGARHPAAARLLITFLMGDDSASGGPGWEPFAVPGDYPLRFDLPTPRGALELSELGAWSIDPERILRARDRVAELVLRARG